ncbi:uncharacterized protein K452DRAFT_305792 [Aplosporella prunicola CBS 121167]|uniref:AB hydrolase-1 domain-containing protein n=1 Tax=Aplosporella prunicola CBS 121167 TaxID=1176127 RepID=A0A6A6BNZ0_9PEZI|nr:uncharacterized protein K452DRAFT_305792 [Aplosporella prunicola CBS 121167]KAF2145850.1 hypothetical protein K452DRAFT_305792 [Aplosporella prunicola CBS 121167]
MARLSAWALLAALTTAAPTASPQNNTNHTITWTPCSPSLNTSNTTIIECGSLAVPLDWATPHGPQITIGLNRLLARDPAKRIGSVVFNPGGPGGVATDDITREAAAELDGIDVGIFTPGVRDSFDIVGFDPRGVGSSNPPVRCNTTLWNERVTLFPTNETEFEKMVAHNKALGESCFELTGPLFAHLDTTSVARDLEAVRQALDNGAKLNFLGLSYGTQIAAAYAELFPENIRAMALDGNVDHSTSETSTLFAEAWTYETELTRFAVWCANATKEDCVLYDRDVLDLWDNVTAAADKKPIPAPACTVSNACRADVTGEEIRQNAQGWLSFKSAAPLLGLGGWGGLAGALAQAAAGNASLLSTPVVHSNTSVLFPSLAVGCLDWEHGAREFADLAYKEAMGRVIAPHTWGMSQSYSYQAGCLGWPVPVTNPQHLANASMTAKAPPLLMVNSEWDPSTSYIWAEGLREQLPSAVLLTREGDGHISYILGGEAAKVIDRYFVNLTLPEDYATVEN